MTRPTQHDQQRDIKPHTTTMTMPRTWTALTVLLLVGRRCQVSHAYVPPEVRRGWSDNKETVRTDAVRLIEECTQKGCNSSPDPRELFWAVKYLDRNANEHYRDEKEKLMERTNGSWELRLPCNSDKDQEFYAHPEFRHFAKAFCTVKDDYYGKGIGTLDDGFCFVAIGGPSTRDVKRRRVFMNYIDFFISGSQVPSWDLSYYLRGWNRVGQSKAETKKLPLAFTVILTTDSTLVVRGSKTGGMAIFRRIAEDMSEVAGFNSKSGVV